MGLEEVWREAFAPDSGALLDILLTAENASADREWSEEHCIFSVNPTDESVFVDEPRRQALSRYHTVLHIVNTIAIRDFGAWITGAQINTDYARIDFKWDGFSPAVRDQIEDSVNSVISGDHALRASWVSEEEFHRRPELLRTLEVKPPVIDGRVRIVEIEGFDAQACGGTHVHSTRRLGRFRVTKTENKGKINKRLYVELHAG